MKVNVTCSGCEITVEEIDGKCTVVATQDGEVVEEFTVDCEETEGSEEEVEMDELDVDSDVDVDSDMEEESDDDYEVEEDEEMMEGVKTFSKFFNKPTKKKRRK